MPQPRRSTLSLEEQAPRLQLQSSPARLEASHPRRPEAAAREGHRRSDRGRTEQLPEAGAAPSGQQRRRRELPVSESDDDSDDSRRDERGVKERAAEHVRASKKGKKEKKEKKHKKKSKKEKSKKGRSKEERGDGHVEGADGRRAHGAVREGLGPWEEAGRKLLL